MPKGERTYSKEFKLGAVYLLMSKASPPPETFRFPLQPENLLFSL